MAKNAKKFKHEPMPLNIGGLRKERGLTQEEMAELLGVSQPMIHRLEKGTYNWNQEFLQECADKLGLSILDLLPINKLSKQKNKERSELIELIYSSDHLQLQQMRAILAGLRPLSDE